MDADEKNNSDERSVRQLMTVMPLSRRHIWIVFVASLGQMIGTGLATLAGVIIPMIEIMRRNGLSSMMQGIIGCIDLVGIALGSMAIGRLSDRFGYLLFFRLGPVLMFVSALVSAMVPDVWVLIICLFFIGVGIGGEYSLDSGYISELMPVRWRSEMIGVAKAASALGNIIVAALCFIFISSWKSADSWPRLMWIIVVMAAFMFVVRIRFFESPKWLADHGKYLKAQKAVCAFLGPDAVLPQSVSSYSTSSPNVPISVPSFFKKNWKKVIFSGIPWACEGLGVYGIGVFLPILVMALGLQSADPAGPGIFHVISSVEITFWISCIILPGFAIGLILIRKGIYLPGLQTSCFFLSAISLIFLILAYHFNWAPWISIVSFMAFEIFLNAGPHLVTYVLPPKIYPVMVRGQGSGMAASIGKIGAVLAVFFIPVLLKSGGVVLVLAVSVAVMLIGGGVTMRYSRIVMPDKAFTSRKAEE